MYKIVSPRVGTPGDIYKPVEGVNVEALLEHGFIVKAKPKTAKTDNIPDNKESEQ